MSLLGATSGSASAAGASSNTGGAAGCATASTIIFIRLDRFAPQASYRTAAGSSLLWKPYYWAVEGETGAFRITRDSDDCTESTARASFAVADDSAVNGEDFTRAPGQTKPLEDPVHFTTGPNEYYQDVSFPVHANAGPEPVVERALVRLTSLTGGAQFGNPREAPFYLIDNQTAGFAFAEPTYSHSEFGPMMPLPVFRGGPATTSQTVTFSVEGTGDNPAVEGENFKISDKSLTFAAGERVKVIDFSIINNRQSDGDRTFKVTLEGQSQQDQTEITLLDAGGEPPIKPRSRFHHPRDGWKYKRNDFRIREVHTFAFDNGGPEIEWAEFALRKKMRSGRCSWWNGSKFKGGKCSAKKWLRMKRFGDFGGKLLYIYNVRTRLRPTQGTRIRTYTGFTRVGNIAGARETTLKRGRNLSHFKVTR